MTCYAGWSIVISFFQKMFHVIIENDTVNNAIIQNPFRFFFNQAKIFFFLKKKGKGGFR